MIFINTRPKNRATQLTDAMQHKGLTVLSLPLLELIPTKISELEQQYHHDFCTQVDYSGRTNNSAGYQALVVVSPTAAQIGLAACPTGFIPECEVIAVGHKTAEILRDAGWKVQCPDEYSNEGMMRMVSLSILGNGDKVLIWRGQGGRRLLINHLQKNHVEVHSIAWYQRQCPKNAVDDFESIHQLLVRLKIQYTNHSSKVNAGLNSSPVDIQPTFRPIVLISSGEAFTNWRQLLDENKMYPQKGRKQDTQFQLTDFNYLTFGKRLTDTLMNLKLSCVQVEHLDVDEVWRGVELFGLGPE